MAWTSILLAVGFLVVVLSNGVALVVARTIVVTAVRILAEILP